ncbi:MAG: PAS domain S-box protein [Syntrophaceae bacterium]|nr:PAS domain S-box protein [Syntrophaceae bacterium]
MIDTTSPTSAKPERLGNSPSSDRATDRKKVKISPEGYLHLSVNWSDIQKTFQAMNRGLILADSQGCIVQINSIAESLMGLKRTQILKKHLSELPWEITCPNGFPIPAERMPDIRALKERRAIRDAVIGLVRSDASRSWLSISAAPLTNERKGIESLILTISDVTRVRLAEEALQIRNVILEAVSFSARKFLVSMDWKECLPEVLARLGKAAGVSRTYLFRNFTAPNGELMTTQIAEWTCAPNASQQSNPECQVHRWRGGGMERWISILGNGEVIHGHITDFPESEKAMLEPQDIQSILVVPVRVASEWWGFMGYDECNKKYVWSAAEIDALKAAADTLGGAIERGRLEEKTRQLQENLQNALTKVLSGYLPICAICKKIRDEKNEWRFVEEYIRDHSNLVFSHGICPECTKNFYQESPKILK